MIRPRPGSASHHGSHADSQGKATGAGAQSSLLPRCMHCMGCARGAGDGILEPPPRLRLGRHGIRDVREDGVRCVQLGGEDTWMCVTGDGRQE
jgi:hypothetical protein